MMDITNGSIEAYQHALSSFSSEESANPSDSPDRVPHRRISTRSSAEAPVSHDRHSLERHGGGYESEDDMFWLFSEDDLAEPRSRPTSKLRFETRALTWDFDEEEDEESEGYDTVPPMRLPVFSMRRNNIVREPVIPFHLDDRRLYEFLVNPLEEGYSIKMAVKYEPATRMYSLIQLSTDRIVLTAFRRTDGFKAFALGSNYSIMMPPTDAAVSASPVVTATNNRRSKGRSGDGSLSLATPVRIAKVRGNARRSQYSLFDHGSNPSRTSGDTYEMSRELMAVKFEVVPSVYTRRAASCYVPAVPGHYTRPQSKEEMLVERAKHCDPEVKSLLSSQPGSPRALPRLQDFNGFAKKHSVKNIILQDPETSQVLLRFGKQDRTTFLLEFIRPFSITAAFAVALTSFDSRVRPSRQL